MDEHAIDSLRATAEDTLTASHMLYWMTAARVSYIVVAAVLQRVSHAYGHSTKQLNLANYWLQLIVYTPTLGMFLWCLVSIYSDDYNTVELGVRLYANIGMLLLAFYSMELYIRGHLMDPMLIFHHVLLIIIVLYVIAEDPTVDDPRDLFMFGIIDGIAAVNEQPTWIAMIHYRIYSDSSPEDKKRLKSKTVAWLRWSVFTFGFFKVGLIVGSLTWYSVRFEFIRNSNLAWVVPVLRFVHAPAPLWSFYIQYKLYLKVKNDVTSPPESGDKLDNTDSTKAVETDVEVGSSPLPSDAVVSEDVQQASDDVSENSSPEIEA